MTGAFQRRVARKSCPACGARIPGPGYTQHGVTYCCEKCYFRDRFLGDAVRHIEGAYLATIEALVEAIDAREHEVGSHSFRVTQFAMVLARRMRISGRSLVTIYCGSLLHDIGKIGIPDAILHKPAALSREEEAVMHTHPEIGYRIIGHIGYLAGAAEIIRTHHEHFDGSGYPRGLRAAQIPLGARIFAACDTLDALTVDRPYRTAEPFRAALAYVQSAAGTLFDPEVAAEMAAAQEEMSPYVGRIML